MDPPLERTAIRKVYLRLLTVLSYFLCYLDRINVGFAALTMNKDLAASTPRPTAWPPAPFFWGYLRPRGFQADISSSRRSARAYGSRVVG